MKKYIYILCSLFIATACTRPMTKVVKEENLPADMENTVLLVEEFEYQDPMVDNPYYIDRADSLREATGIVYSSDVREVTEEPATIENPLIKETNENLEEYNSKLANALERYDDKALLLSKEEINMSDYNDLTKYRYVLKRMPVVHCYEDPNGMGVFSYRYKHYFFDRLTGESLPAIEIYSPAPWRTTKAIVQKLNDTEDRDRTTALKQ